MSIRALNTWLRFTESLAGRDPRDYKMLRFSFKFLGQTERNWLVAWGGGWNYKGLYHYHSWYHLTDLCRYWFVFPGKVPQKKIGYYLGWFQSGRHCLEDFTDTQLLVFCFELVSLILTPLFSVDLQQVGCLAQEPSIMFSSIFLPSWIITVYLNFASCRTSSVLLTSETPFYWILLLL